MKAERAIYRDTEGNTYAVEKSSKTGRFIVARINPGGHRKIAKQFADVSGNEAFVQRALNERATREGWREARG